VAYTLKSIFTSFANLDYEIIIVDNNSTDGTLEIVRNFNNNTIKVIKNKRNLGFARANNIAFKVCKGQYIIILNPDITITHKTNLPFLIEQYHKYNDIGIVAPKLLYENGEIQESARSFPNPIVLLIRGIGLGNFFKSFSFYRDYLMLDKQDEHAMYADWVIGAFMLIRRDILEKIGYFDEKYFMYYEDADLCIRLLKSGYKTLYVPNCEVIHKYKRESSRAVFSKLKYHHIKSIVRFFTKHSFYLIFSKQ